MTTMQVRRDENGVAHIVSLSGGKDSTAMALRLAELHPERPFTYICTPTGNELPEMFEHWKRLGELLGQPLIPITAHTGLQGICDEQNALPNFRMRFCTRLLKLAPAARFLVANLPCIVYVGLRADEEMREGARRGGDYLPEDVEGVEQVYPMREWGWGLAEVIAFLEERGVSIPARTDCAWCFYQTLYEWYRLWADHLELYLEGEAIEQRFGYSFRSPQRDTQPHFLRDLRAKFEAGYVPKQRKRPIMCSVCAR